VVSRKSASGTSAVTIGGGSYPNELDLVRRMAFVPKVVPEAKYITTWYSATGIGNTGANGSFIWSPTMPAQSTTATTRIGDRLKFLSLVIKGYFITPDTQTAASCKTVVRCIAFKSEDPAAGSYTAAGLEALFWDNNSTNSYTNSLYFPCLDVNILHDRTSGFTATGSANTASGGRIWPIDVQIPVNQLVKFAPGTQTLRSGSVNVYMVSNSATATDVAFNGSIRAYYQDV